MAFILPTYKAPANVLREYTGSATWNKPTQPSFKGIWIFAVGGGGAGGAGSQPTLSPSGGGGGGGAAFVRQWIPASLLSSSISITVGAGAPGVAAGNGASGSSTLFGTYILAKGGNGGTGGSTTSGTVGGGLGGSALLCVPIASGYSISGGTGGNGARLFGNSTPGTTGNNSNAAPAGGGGTGYVTGNALAGDGRVGGGTYDNARLLVSGGLGGIAPGGSGTAGINDVYTNPFLDFSITSSIGIGTGGGGGAGISGSGNNAGAGAAGGRGAGGGGGGGCQSGGIRGASGAGGNGFVIIYEVY